VTKRKEFNLTKEEKKDLAEHFYKQEEDRWAQASKAYYRPQGAPARLSDELLDQWHMKRGTGIRHPGEVRKTMVKVLYDEKSYSIKNFLTRAGAENFIESVEHYGLAAELITDDKYWAKFMGAF
jgi:hypothetical protein